MIEKNHGEIKTEDNIDTILRKLLPKSIALIEEQTGSGSLSKAKSVMDRSKILHQAIVKYGGSTEPNQNLISSIKYAVKMQENDRKRANEVVHFATEVRGEIKRQIIERNRQQIQASAPVPKSAGKKRSAAVANLPDNTDNERETPNRPEAPGSSNPNAEQEAKRLLENQMENENADGETLLEILDKLLETSQPSSGSEKGNNKKTAKKPSPEMLASTRELLATNLEDLKHAEDEQNRIEEKARNNLERMNSVLKASLELVDKIDEAEEELNRLATLSAATSSAATSSASTSSAAATTGAKRKSDQEHGGRKPPGPPGAST